MIRLVWPARPLLGRPPQPGSFHLFLSLGCGLVLQGSNISNPIPDATEMEGKLHPTPVSGHGETWHPKRHQEHGFGSKWDQLCPRIRQIDHPCPGCWVHTCSGACCPSAWWWCVVREPNYLGVPPAHRSSAPLPRENVHVHFIKFFVVVFIVILLFNVYY